MVTWSLDEVVFLQQDQYGYRPFHLDNEAERFSLHFSALATYVDITRA